MTVSRPYIESLVFFGGISADLRIQVDEFPSEAQPTVWGRDGALTLGGRAAGAATASVRLGRRFVDLVGCVGNDLLGRSILTSLKEDGVNTRLVDVIEEVSTALHEVYLDIHGNRRVVGSPNANARCLENQAKKADSTIFGADLLYATLEIPLSTVNRIVRTAAGRDVPVLLDATPLPTAEGFEDLDSTMMGRADVLLTNFASAQRLAGMAGAPGPNAVELAEKLLARGPRAVVITMGEHGAMLAVAGRHTFVPSFADYPLDLSSAGYAFGGGLAVGLTNQTRGNWRWEQLVYAVQFASATAAVCIQRKGGVSSLPKRDEVERLLAQQTVS
jgi:ribokinase